MPLAPITYPLTILHKPKRDSNARWDHSTGVRRARRAGATAIDVNSQAAKDGWAATHWSQPGEHEFTAPDALRHRACRTLTLSQLGQFTSHAKDSKGLAIQSLREVMETAAEINMTLCVEVKSTGDFEQMAADAQATGCRVIVMTLPHLGGKNAGYKRLAAARRAGLPTMVLLNVTRFARGQVPKDQWANLDYTKGPVIWQRGRPARVVRLGAGSKYGITVTTTNARRVTARLSKHPPAPTGPPLQPPPPKPPPVKPPVEAPMTSAEKIIKIAKSYVGYHEGRSGGHWNNDNKFAKKMGWANFQAWCATFVCSVFDEAGLIKLIATPSPGVDQLAVGFKKAKRWSEYPAVGAVVFYGSPRDLNHTGIVVDYDAASIWTVEGNTNDSGSREGDGVYLKTRKRRDINVVGYGYPNFAEPIKSADPDPKWARPGTKPQAGGVKPWPRDGIDLSHHNDGRIDWNKAKAAGIRFCYHKATEATGFRDDMYASRRAEIRSVPGVLFGAYHFARPSKSSGVAQARFFLSVAKPRKGELRPVLDLEDRGGLSDAALDKWVGDWVAEVTKATGKPPIVYCPQFSLRSTHKTWLWVARYHDKNERPNVPKPWKDWTIHQFSNGVNGNPHTVPGIAMPVDIDTLAPGFDINRLKL